MEHENYSGDDRYWSTVNDPEKPREKNGGCWNQKKNQDHADNNMKVVKCWEGY